MAQFRQSIGELQRQISLQSQTSYGESETDPLCVLPPEMILAVFDYVPLSDIVRVCRLVCKGWQCFLDDPQFWQLRMMQGGNFDHRLRDVPSVCWPKLCKYTVSVANLIKNFVGNDVSLEPWTLSYSSWEAFSQELEGGHGRGRRSGGDKWTIEDGWIKSEDPRNVLLLKENGSSKNYVTSYEWCCREQIIDLPKLGFLPTILDELQPAIDISEWFCARWDCGSVFQIWVDLLDEKRHSVKNFQYSKKTSQWQGGEQGWLKVQHSFTDYGPGVRFVRFADGGKDLQWWAGHYGSKMAAARVSVKFSSQC